MTAMETTAIKTIAPDVAPAMIPVPGTEVCLLVVAVVVKQIQV